MNAADGTLSSPDVTVAVRLVADPGPGFESDDAVRGAAYGYRQRERRREHDREVNDGDGE